MCIGPDFFRNIYDALIIITYCVYYNFNYTNYIILFMITSQRVKLKPRPETLDSGFSETLDSRFERPGDRGPTFIKKVGPRTQNKDQIVIVLINLLFSVPGPNFLCRVPGFGSRVLGFGSHWVSGFTLTHPSSSLTHHKGDIITFSIMK